MWFFDGNKFKTFLWNHPEIYQLNAGIIRNEGLAKSFWEDRNFISGN